MKFLFLFLFFTLLSCESIKYVDDITFTSSAQANSPELPVYIDGKFCKDLHGIPGLCSKRIRRNSDIVLSIPKQQYQYKLYFKCSKDLGINFSQDVPAYIAFNYTIKRDAFKSVESFTCIGESHPQDRDDKISSFFEIRFVVVNSDYIPREISNIYSYKGHDYLMLGSHAKYSTVIDYKGSKKITTYLYQKPVIKIYSKDKVKAISESYKGRFNFYGFDNDDLDTRRIDNEAKED